MEQEFGNASWVHLHQIIFVIACMILDWHSQKTHEKAQVCDNHVLQISESNQQDHNVIFAYDLDFLIVRRLAGITGFGMHFASWLRSYFVVVQKSQHLFIRFLYDLHGLLFVSKDTFQKVLTLRIFIIYKDCDKN